MIVDQGWGLDAGWLSRHVQEFGQDVLELVLQLSCFKKLKQKTVIVSLSMQPFHCYRNIVQKYQMVWKISWFQRSIMELQVSLNRVSLFQQSIVEIPAALNIIPSKYQLVPKYNHRNISWFQNTITEIPVGSNIVFWTPSGESYHWLLCSGRRTILRGSPLPRRCLHQS